MDAFQYVRIEGTSTVRPLNPNVSSNWTKSYRDLSRNNWSVPQTTKTVSRLRKVLAKEEYYRGPDGRNIKTTVAVY